jgi:hypothetical protein
MAVIAPGLRKPGGSGKPAAGIAQQNCAVPSKFLFFGRFLAAAS